MTRILIYSHDTYGLGNIRRMVTIAQSLTQADPTVSVLIITGSPMLHAFRLPDRIDYVKLPCLTRTDAGQYDVAHLAISQDSARRMRSGIIASATIEFDPDIVLVDKKPLGVGGELFAALEILQQRLNPPKLCLVLRDIIDAPEATRDVWAKNNYHRHIAAFYDDIYVVGSKDIFDLAKEYDFPDATTDKITYTGFIRRSSGRASPADLRSRLGIGDDKIVLVQAGGGGDGIRLIDAYLDALTHYRGGASYFSWIIAGPEMPRADRSRILRKTANIPNALVQEFSDDMNACINTADYVVSMGGYNSICEILSLGKPALIVPRVKPVSEQLVRAERLALNKTIDVLHPNHLSGQAMLGALEKLVHHGDSQLQARKYLDMGGLEKLPHYILHSIEATPAYSARAANAAGA